jgi:hypothetical protein
MVVRRIVYAAMFFAVFATYVARARESGAMASLPQAGDEVDYDAIAFSVWQGHGIGFNWDNPAWREPYLEAPGYENVLARRSSYYPTSYRPPAVPVLMGLVYTLTNRNFAAWRIFQCALMAGAVTVAAMIAAGVAGLPGAVLTALLALQSHDLTARSATRARKCCRLRRAGPTRCPGPPRVSG